MARQPRRLFRILARLIILVMVIVLAAILARWGLEGLAGEDEESNMHVQIETVQKAMFVVRVSERGDLEALEEVEIKSDVAGVVKELYVEDGDHVNEAQELFRIDDEYITQRLKATQAEYDVAKGQVEQTRISGALEMRRIEYDIEMSRKGLESAEANLEAVVAVGEQQILQAESALKKLETDAVEQYKTEAERAQVALTKAQLDVKTKKAALDITRSDATRYQQLLERGFVSQSQYDLVQKQLNEAQASYKSAAEDERLAQLNCDFTKKKQQQLTQEILDQKRVLEKARQAVKAQGTEAQLRVDQQRKQLQNQLDSVDDQKKNAEVRVQSSQKYMERSQADLSRLQEELRWTTKRAPRSGTITDCEIEVGQAVASGRSEWGGGQPIMKISDLSQMVVRTYVNEMEISKMHEGLRAEIFVSAYPERVFDGKVWKIAPTAKLRDNIRSFEVTVLLTNASSQLRPQMTANVDIIASERDNVLQMPISALIEKDATLVFAQIPERHISSFRTDQRLNLRLPNDSRMYPAQVTRIPTDKRHIDDQIIYEMRLRVEDNPDEFRWGPPTPMSLFLSDTHVLADVICIVHKEKEPYALLLKRENLSTGDASLIETQEVRLEIGERNESNIEILEGLAEGDRVRVPELSRKDLFMWED